MSGQAFLCIYREIIVKSSCQKLLGGFRNNLTQIVMSEPIPCLLKLKKKQHAFQGTVLC